jgi:hypothetical protein
MPYIHESSREAIDPFITPLAEQLHSPGDLNYAITRLFMQWLLDKGIDYGNINSVAGVLQKAMAEFDERVTRPYEDLKLKQNGDVPEYSAASAQISQMGRALPANHAPDTIQAHG